MMVIASIIVPEHLPTKKKLVSSMVGVKPSIAYLPVTAARARLSAEGRNVMLHHRGRG